MKSVLLALTLALTLTLTPCEALAQPTITMCNRTFNNGEFINYHTIQYDTFGVTAGVGGANAVWDYSNLTTQSSMTHFKGFYYPQNTPYGFFFPFCQYCLNFDLNYSFARYAYLAQCDHLLRVSLFAAGLQQIQRSCFGSSLSDEFHGCFLR